MEKTEEQGPYEQGQKDYAEGKPESHNPYRAAVLFGQGGAKAADRMIEWLFGWHKARLEDRPGDMKVAMSIKGDGIFLTTERDREILQGYAVSWQALDATCDMLVDIEEAMQLKRITTAVLSLGIAYEQRCADRNGSWTLNTGVAES